MSAIENSEFYPPLKQFLVVVFEDGSVTDPPLNSRLNQGYIRVCGTNTVEVKYSVPNTDEFFWWPGEIFHQSGKNIFYFFIT